MKNRVSNITIENVAEFQVPLSQHLAKWRFEDEDGNISLEFEDQIIVLEDKAAKFMWDFESTQRHLGNIPKMNEHFKVVTEFYSGRSPNESVKKWLYNLGIPFDQQVFWIDQPHCGYILTWKMIIKFSEVLFFGSDAVIWDRSVNWCLNYHHDDMFHFGKNQLDNSDKRSIEIQQSNILINSLSEKRNQKK